MTTDVKHNQQATFVLKLTGIDLENINPVDIADLLKDFSKLLGKDNLHFKEIRQGSAILELETPSEFYNEKVNELEENISEWDNSLENINKIMRKYSSSFPLLQGKIFACRVACNEEIYEEIYEFDYKKPTATRFEQDETLIGKLINPAQGKDSTDHFTIKLANEKTVSVQLPKILSNQLAPELESLWLHENLVQFNGIARYEMVGYEIKIISFKAKSFDIIPNRQTATDWVDEFISFGESGWQSLDNPLETWLEERH